MALFPKTTVNIGGFSVSGHRGVSWKFVTGTRPFQTTLSTPTRLWNQMKDLVGQPVALTITDRSRAHKIEQVYILHEAPSDSPHRTNFVVSDKRWKWDRILVSRDYNMTKRSGDRRVIPAKTGKLGVGPVPLPDATTIDLYDYKGYSLKDGEKKWTPKEAVEDVLRQIEPKDEAFRVDSFPIETPGEGEFSIQNMVLNDSGDVALGRVLSAVPGAEVYIDESGAAVVFDGADLSAAERHFNSLPPSTRDGEKAEFIHRAKVRPKKVQVFFMREVEAVFEYSDDYSGGTSAAPRKNDPVIENVIPTVDPVTTIPSYFDYETGKTIKNAKLAPGTWVPVREWLAAMEVERKSEGIVSFPWTFETIRRLWMFGNMDGKLGAGGRRDIDQDGNVAARVSALKQHFRQTFRISRRYMERIRDVQATRAMVIDPVAGMRAPAAAWGQITIISTKKGEGMSYRLDPNRKGVHRMVDTLPQAAPPGETKKNLIRRPPLPLGVSMIDRDLGIFRITFIASPYGTDARYVPGHLCFPDGRKKAHVRDLAMQDRWTIGDGFKIENGTNAQLLCDTMELKVMLTIVPAGPNNKGRYHMVEVLPKDIRQLYRSEYRIENGEGPPLQVFVTPNLSTARFQWQQDVLAKATLERLLGLNSDDPDKAGLVDDPTTGDIDESKMNGYNLVNEQRQLKEHAKAIAAEQLIFYADNLQGNPVTRMPASAIELKGNMGGATIGVAAAPSAKVQVSHQFPGQSKPISSLALMPESTRQIVLGIIPFGQGDK